MEDNEPLSRRRARLKGEEMHFANKGPFEQQRSSTMYTLDIPTLSDKLLEEREEETLAQRSQRIKAEKEAATGLGVEFTKDVSSQPGLKAEHVAPTATTPEAEETLGQRRKRLQEETLRNSRQPSRESSQNLLGLKARSSMADILSQHPATSARQPSSNGQHDNRMSYMPTFPQPMTNHFAMPGMMPSYPSFNAGMPYLNGAASFSYNNPMMYNPGMAIQMGGYGQNAYMQDPMMMEAPLDPKQRDMIDRWRQSVAQ